jgi:hypothetical protein
MWSEPATPNHNRYRSGLPSCLTVDLDAIDARNIMQGSVAAFDRG